MPAFLYFVGQMRGPVEYMLTVFVCILLTVAGLVLLANFKRLFVRMRPAWLRTLAAAWVVLLCFLTALTPINGQILHSIEAYGWVHTITGQLFLVTAYTLVVFNTARVIATHPALAGLSFLTRSLLVLLSIILTTVIVTVGMHWLSQYYDQTGTYNMEVLHYSMLINLYFGMAAGLVFVLVNYKDLEQKRRFDAKELELSRLRESKATAELDALYSKVNPHFLYNALNSIAELALVDGRKARKMTIALADLFRYSMNYSKTNYATLEEELEMTGLYLHIEKIRFEDQLNYTVQVDPAFARVQVPRFILQPLAENAVKHGLRVTGHMTEIRIVVTGREGGMQISIEDNGPAFPGQLNPGYGIKSVYDKMDLLFPGAYEIYFSSRPMKAVTIFFPNIQKL
ncbi:MAG: hypothetical protein EOO05_03940 [Chitinophagaceae bacterium]|nr:MAG: hypothetical protein EOO05_03940 [Chitinophagaceae bacterium]